MEIRPPIWLRMLRFLHLSRMTPAEEMAWLLERNRRKAEAARIAREDKLARDFLKFKRR